MFFVCHSDIMYNKIYKTLFDNELTFFYINGRI